MTKIQGDNIDCPGQILVGQPPTNTKHVVRHDDARLRYHGTASLSGIQLNDADPVDVGLLPISTEQYLPFKFGVFNPIGDVSVAKLGLYTGPLASGIEIVAPTVLGNLIGMGKFQLLPVSNLTELVTASSLYVYLELMAPAPGTVDLVLWFHDLSNIVGDSL